MRVGSGAEADAEELAAEVAALAEAAAAGFRTRCAALQFPWLGQTEP